MRKKYTILVFALLIVVAIGFSSGSASTLTIGNKTFTAAGETADIDLYLDSLPDGLSGYKFNMTMGDTAVAEFTGITDSTDGVTPPAWFVAIFENDGIVAPNDAFIKIWDSKRDVEPGATNVFLCSVRVTATGPGTTAITLTNIQIDGDGGEMIIPAIVGGIIQVDGSKRVPEFPFIFLPVTMIIGFLGAVLLTQRTREP